MSEPRVIANGQSRERLLQEAGFSGHEIRDLCRSRSADASEFVTDIGAFVRRLENAGVATAAARKLTLVAYGPNIRFPWLMADEVVSHFISWHSAGMPRPTASLLACALWSHDPSNARQTGNAALNSYQELLANGLSAEEAGDLVLAEYSAGHTFEKTSDSMERRIMFDKDTQRDAVNYEASREREQQRLEREQEKIEREKERLEREQERLEREQERLERMQEQLEERQEQLEELEEELEEIEIEDVEDVREVLDVVTEQIPHLMRGIQDSLYSAEQMKKMGESIATLYKSLVDAGMDKDQASTITMMQVSAMQDQMRPRRHTSIHHRPPRPSRPHDLPGFPEGFPPESPGAKPKDAEEA